MSFDRVDHEGLRGLVRRRVRDRRVLTLIAQWLRAGVVVDGRRQRTRGGVPQGGVVSPWRSTLSLHTRDRGWPDRDAGVGQLHRDCDDVVIVGRSRQGAEQARELVAGFLGRVQLTLHPQKTRVVDLGKEGFDFLGFVRHEVAYTAVMTQRGGHNLVCCHQYPTQTCGWSNPAV